MNDNLDVYIRKEIRSFKNLIKQLIKEFGSPKNTIGTVSQIVSGTVHPNQRVDILLPGATTPMPNILNGSNQSLNIGDQVVIEYIYGSSINAIIKFKKDI